MKAEAPLERRCRLLFALGVDLDQGGVDVQEHRSSARRRRRTGPELGPHGGQRLGDTDTGGRTDLVEGAKDRGVRRHRSEEVAADAEVFDVETALTTTGQHKCGLDEYLAAVVQWEAAPGPRDTRRQRITKPQSVGKTPKGVQADVSNHPRSHRIPLRRDECC
jgi:hypothetical protein